jgi:hypothetical protein
VKAIRLPISGAGLHCCRPLAAARRMECIDLVRMAGQTQRRHEAGGDPEIDTLAGPTAAVMSQRCYSADVFGEELAARARREGGSTGDCRIRQYAFCNQIAFRTGFQQARQPAKSVGKRSDRDCRLEQPVRLHAAVNRTGSLLVIINVCS